MRVPAYLTAFALAVTLLASPAFAQDAKDKETIAKQIATAKANIAKAEIGQTVIVETEHFLIATTLTETKAKELGKVLDAVVPVARKALKYEASEVAWPGKLTLYHLPRNRDFKGFIRATVMRDPEGLHVNLQAAAPFVVDPVEVPPTASEDDQFANAAAIMAGAYLQAKAGSSVVPSWLTDGFGRVTVARATGPRSPRYQAYKRGAKIAVLRPAGGKLALADLWGETKPANAELIADSFAEYLAYGPGEEKFLDVILAFRPAENGDVPTPPKAFESAGWKDMAALEQAWARWVATRR